MDLPSQLSLQSPKKANSNRYTSGLANHDTRPQVDGQPVRTNRGPPHGTHVLMHRPPPCSDTLEGPKGISCARGPNHRRLAQRIPSCHQSPTATSRTGTKQGASWEGHGVLHTTSSCSTRKVPPTRTSTVWAGGGPTGRKGWQSNPLAGVPYDSNRHLEQRYG